MSEDPIQRSAIEFAAAARRFMAVVEDHKSVPVDELLLALHPLLSELTFRASVLPDVWSDHDSPEDRHTRAEWQRLFRSLTNHLGDHDVYWEVFDPVDHSSHEAIRGTLADDLADIYFELRPGLEAVRERRGRIPHFVIWQWRFGFYLHWGHHAIDATRTIHALISHHGLGEEGDEDETAPASA